MKKLLFILSFTIVCAFALSGCQNNKTEEKTQEQPYNILRSVNDTENNDIDDVENEENNDNNNSDYNCPDGDCNKNGCPHCHRKPHNDNSQTPEFKMGIPKHHHNEDGDTENLSEEITPVPKTPRNRHKNDNKIPAPRTPHVSK